MPIEFFGRQLSATKQFRSGTHRSRSPEETLAAYRPLLPRFGITRIANITGLDTIDAPTYTAIRPNSRTLATSQGKGLDAPAAKASAMMECIEFWHAEYVSLPIRRESYSILKKSVHVIDPATLPIQLGQAFVPERCSLWVEGFDIAQRRAAWVPLDLVCIDELEPPAIFCQSTNGLSSGNHLLEAIVHGLCEVIERDAEALWRLSNEMRRLDLSTVNTPYCREVLRRIEAANVFTAVWDISRGKSTVTYVYDGLARLAMTRYDTDSMSTKIATSGQLDCEEIPRLSPFARVDSRHAPVVQHRRSVQPSRSLHASARASTWPRETSH